MFSRLSRKVLFLLCLVMICSVLKLLQERYSLPPVDLDGRDEALEEA